MRNLWHNSVRVALAALCAGILFGEATSALALDIFGSRKSEEANPPVPEKSGALPSLSETVKNASPAVVNISTTQKVEKRRSPRFGPMPGPSPFGGDHPFEEFFRRFFPDRPPPGQSRSLGSAGE